MAVVIKIEVRKEEVALIDGKELEAIGGISNNAIGKVETKSGMRDCFIPPDGYSGSLVITSHKKF